MPVIIGSIEDLGLNYLIFTGSVSRDDLQQFPGRLTRSGYMSGVDWVVYFDPNADLSDVDAACLFDLKKELAIVISAFHDAGDLNVLLLLNSNDDVVAQSWWTLVGTDPDYPTNPLLAKDFSAAAYMFGLTEAQCQIAKRRIEDVIAGEVSP